MISAAIVNAVTIGAAIVDAPSTHLQWFTVAGVFFSATCSVVAVLITHHVKVIVNSRMTEMVKLAGQAGELKERDAQVKRDKETKSNS